MVLDMWPRTAPTHAIFCTYVSPEGAEEAEGMTKLGSWKRASRERRRLLVLIADDRASLQYVEASYCSKGIKRHSLCCEVQKCNHESAFHAPILSS